MIKANIENFSENELKCRCGCGLCNMDDEFLIRLQAFRYLLGKPLTVTSGGRCTKHNLSKQVGGSPNSCHICDTKKATACDVTNSNCYEIYIQACRCSLFNEVIYYKNKNFVHLGLDRKQAGKYYEVK